MHNVLAMCGIGDDTRRVMSARAAEVNRRDMPVGAVTFVMTDIEGSTRLLIALGDAYGRVRADRRGILPTHVSAHGGVEVDTQGDASRHAFGDAASAVAAAAAAQRELS